MSANDPTIQALLARIEELDRRVARLDSRGVTASPQVINVAKAAGADPAGGVWFGRGVTWTAAAGALPAYGEIMFKRSGGGAVISGPTGGYPSGAAPALGRFGIVVADLGASVAVQVAGSFTSAALARALGCWGSATPQTLVLSTGRAPGDGGKAGRIILAGSADALWNVDPANYGADAIEPVVFGPPLVGFYLGGESGTFVIEPEQTPRMDRFLTEANDFDERLEINQPLDGSMVPIGTIDRYVVTYRLSDGIFVLDRVDPTRMRSSGTPGILGWSGIAGEQGFSSKMDPTATGQVVTYDGTKVLWGTVGTAGIADDAVTNAKLGLTGSTNAVLSLAGGGGVQSHLWVGAEVRWLTQTLGGLPTWTRADGTGIETVSDGGVGYEIRLKNRGVTFAKFAEIAALAVVCRSTNTAGDAQALGAPATNCVFARQNNILEWTQFPTVGGNGFIGGLAIADTGGQVRIEIDSAASAFGTYSAAKKLSIREVDVCDGGVAKKMLILASAPY